MKLQAFVAMPFGKKPGHDGNLIDFDVIYTNLIKPAIEAAGLMVIRADEEQAAGDIKTDMFQELLMADLVVADLTLDNPNVWYELGVRHALRARGIVLVQGPRPTQPFDSYTDRKYRYSLSAGVPDPVTLTQDLAKITRMISATLESWQGRKISPVYQLLPNLIEPQWKTLRIGDTLEFWQSYDAWETRIDLASHDKNIGDLLVLADEAPIAAFRAEAHIKAGIALRKVECFDFALEQLELGLSFDMQNLTGLQEKGVCLQRLALQNHPGHSLEKARSYYHELLKNYPHNADILALQGRLSKDAWIATWQRSDWNAQQKRDEAGYQDALLRAAIDSYLEAFRCNLRHYYSGINALTLMCLYQELTGDAQFSKEVSTMACVVRFAAECETNEEQDYWAKATLGDLEVVTGKPATVSSAYKVAITKAENNWFALNSTVTQLRLLAELNFRPLAVAAGLATFERALANLRKPDSDWQPRMVLLFSGHMIDAPGRTPPRFPANKEPLAAAKIAETLDKLAVNPNDIALTQGTSGGDLLFAEACLKRGVKVMLLQPLEEPEFIQKSVVPAGEVWRDRYFALKSKLLMLPRAAPIELGEAAQGINPYERCNLWLLYSALAYGIDKVQFICLWNGGGGDGPGGTAHMYNEVKNRTGQVHWLDTRLLW